ncbi:CHC2 zinc finger domain-containing protein [Algoriphagus formosus]|uniref:CHC2 zinc finger domain-containing protein n=1 Tax=Algoriphagus formosus TaxID=2007308 RepID=UPI000C294C4E|nr:CHC2 zinc finger domain-containing protein [Algoriphagus formosus]
MRGKLSEEISRNSLRVFEHFLASKYPKGKLIPGKNISNPFLSHLQRTPSFNVFKAKDGSYLFNDYATGDRGSVITFVMRIKNTNYQDAVKTIIDILK